MNLSVLHWGQQSRRIGAQSGNGRFTGSCVLVEEIRTIERHLRP